MNRDGYFPPLCNVSLSPPGGEGQGLLNLMENVNEAFNDFYFLIEKKLIGRGCVRARL